MASEWWQWWCTARTEASTNILYSKTLTFCCQDYHNISVFFTLKPKSVHQKLSDLEKKGDFQRFLLDSRGFNKYIFKQHFQVWYTVHLEINIFRTHQLGMRRADDYLPSSSQSDWVPTPRRESTTGNSRSERASEVRPVYSCCPIRCEHPSTRDIDFSSD